MFKHQGPARSARNNAILAGTLALVAGFVNSAGFLLIGTFSSHVTGSVGRFSVDLAQQQLQPALFALLLVGSFWLGAFVASLLVESRRFGGMSGAYGVALLCEALLLAALPLWLARFPAPDATTRDVLAALLCVAMGMQNSFVTRLSGAVIRTTHLTGVVTDLGIEAARWVHWWRGRSGERPGRTKVVLLTTIATAFAVGAVAGALGALQWGAWVALAPAVVIGGASLYAFSERNAAPDNTANNT